MSLPTDNCLDNNDSVVASLVLHSKPIFEERIHSLNAIVNDYKRFLRVCNKSRQSRYSAVEHYKPPFLMSSHGIPPSSSKNHNPSSSLKPKPQPPKEYVQMRNERLQENKEILRDGLTPVDRVRSEQQFGTKQKLNEINPKNKP
ncbi:hypothetical protein QTP88_010481 [Uroleucon formosanum]